MGRGRVAWCAVTPRRVLFASVLLLMGIAIAFFAWRDGPRAVPARMETPETARPPAEPRAPAAQETTPSERTEAAAPSAAPSDEEQPELFDWRAELHGRVVEYVTGEPIAAARVTVVPTYRGSPASGLSGADGGFVIDGLQIPAAVAPGSLSLRIDADGYATYFSRPVVEHGRRERDPSQTQQFDAGDVRLRRGAIVRGEVVSAEDGEPLPSVPLYLFYGTRGLVSPVPEWEGDPRELARFALRVGTSDERGAFELEQRVSAITSNLHLLALAEEGIGWAPLEFAEGIEQLDVQVPVRPGGFVSLLVEDEQGRPVAGALASLRPGFDPIRSLNLMSGHALQAEPWTSEMLLEGRTDEAGRILFGRLPFGAEEEQYGLSLRTSERFDPHDSQVRPSAGPDEPIRVVLRRSLVLARIAGRVVNEAGGPIAAARVEAAGIAAESDGAGRYELRGPFEARQGRVLVTAAREGYSPARRVVDFDEPGAEDPEPLELVLAPAAPVAGIVVDQHGVALPGVELALDGEGYRSSQRADESGRFRFGDSPGGALFLRADWLEPRERWWRPALEVRGGDQQVSFVCTRLAEPRGVLEARVFDATTSQPIAPLAVSLGGSVRSPSSRPTSTAIVRTLGRVRIERLHPGPWNLVVHCPEGAIASAHFEVPADRAPVEIDVPVGGPGAIEGRVVADALPSRARVCAQIEGGVYLPRPLAGSYHTEGRAAVDADGTFRLEGLLGGRYRVTLHAGELTGEVLVDLPAGGTAAAVIEARSGARLHVVSERPWLSATIGFRVRVDEGPWDTFRDAVRQNEPLDLVIDVQPGHVEWELFPLGGDGFDVDPPRPERWAGGAVLRSQTTWTVRLDRF